MKPIKTAFAQIFFGVGVYLAAYTTGSVTGCGPLSKGLVKTIADQALVDCVYASRETDAEKLADGCEAARTLVPVIVDLVGQREEAKAASMARVGLTPPRDAGKD